MSDNKTVIAVLIALEEEFLEFQNRFEIVDDKSRDGKLCFSHESGNDNIELISILADTMGASSARSSASYMIDNFEPNLVVVLGIAGGISSDLSIGDVCVSSEIIDIINNTKVSERDGLPEIEFSPEIFSISQQLITSFRYLKVHPEHRLKYEQWQNKAQNNVKDLSLEGEMDGMPTFEIGPIVSGPVSGSNVYNKSIKKIDRKISAIETESGGIFQETRAAEIPGIAIRGISDLADSDKNKLEERTKNKGRKLAMINACELLALQLQSEEFLNVAKVHAALKLENDTKSLFPDIELPDSLPTLIEKNIKLNLENLCPEYKSKPDEFHLPIPRLHRIFYSEDAESRDYENPIDLSETVQDFDCVAVRLPRSYPNQTLGLSFAKTLLKEHIDDRIILPFVVSGADLKPPSSGFDKSIISHIDVKGSEIDRSLFHPVMIVEEPDFSSRNKINYFTNEIKNFSGKVIILTKSEDYTINFNNFINENNVCEYELSPVSFTELAHFVEKAFSMPPREAEIVAIKLESTFRNFGLDAHPTYFAGLQEETLMALINANKRAELIQLAVYGLLSLIVAADNAKPRLGRTTRENFLKEVVLEKIKNENFDDASLNDLTANFLKRNVYDVTQAEFLNPFFQSGLLFHSDRKILFTHPYLENYLLAVALKENSEEALKYFDPKKLLFNFYAYDLYCELGPDDKVIKAVEMYTDLVLSEAKKYYTEEHVYLKSDRPLSSASSVAQIKSFASRLFANAEKMEAKNDNTDVRSEKQRLLDTRKQARKKVSNKQLQKNDDLPAEILKEFEILDGLSRSLALNIISVGSGAETIVGDKKRILAKNVISVGDKFTDIWTRNRLRINFEKSREEMLSDEKIWEFMNSIGAEDDDYETVKADLSLFITEMETHMIVEPLRRVAWKISASASSKVLSPIVKDLVIENAIQGLLKGCWYLDVDSNSGQRFLKSALQAYKGNSLLRLAIAHHCLDKSYWHHYKTAEGKDFILSAKRALSPLGLSPGKEKLDVLKPKKKKRKKKSS